MIVAKEEPIMATNRRRIQRIKATKNAARSTEIRPAKFREKLCVISNRPSPRQTKNSYEPADEFAYLLILDIEFLGYGQS